MSVAVSARWQQALSRPHKPVAYVTVLRDQRVITDLPVLSGQVTADRHATVRRSLKSLVVVDRNQVLVPSAATSTLAPYGNEIQVFTGIDYLDGSPPELKSLGVFPIAEDSIVHQAGYTLTVSGFDRSRHIQRNKYASAFAIVAGADYIGSMETVLNDRLANIIAPPGITIRALVSTTIGTTLQVFKVGDDGWKKLTDMATAIGAEIFFQRDGYAVIAPIVDLSTSNPQWDFVGGRPGTLVQVTNDVKNDPGFNGSVIDVNTSTNTAPLHSEVWDTNPNSPTYYLGRYGKVPNILNSGAAANVTTQGQADAAVAADLLKTRGATQTITFTALPNAAIDEGDVGHVVDPVTKIDGNYIIDQVTWDVGINSAQMMQVVCSKTGALL